MARVGVSGRIAQAFIDNKLTPLLTLAALLLGLMAVVATPREEEPQIVVPMIDLLVGWPGATAEDVERLVTVPLERALREIPGVEYVYATSQPSGAMLIVRFLVNWDPERALINVRDKAANAQALLPAGVMAPQIIPPGGPQEEDSTAVFRNARIADDEQLRLHAARDSRRLFQAHE